MFCPECRRRFGYQNDVYYLFDPEMQHWKACEAQIVAYMRLEPGHLNEAVVYSPSNYPYTGETVSQNIGNAANAGMFNVAKDLLGETMFDGIGLDLGCFRGWVAIQLSQYSTMIAMDINSHQYYGLGSVPNINKGIVKVVADGCCMPFMNNSLDFIIGVSSWHHLHDRLCGLNECYRVLRPGGKIVFTGEHYTSDGAMEVTLNDGIRDYEGMPYSKDDLYKMFNDSDFNIIDLIPIKYTEHMAMMMIYCALKKFIEY